MSIALFFQNINQIEKFQDYLDLKHANIKFSSQIEKINKFSFLGMKFSRENNEFTTSVCLAKTPTFIGVFTNLESCVLIRTNTPKSLLCYTQLSNFVLILSYLNKKLKI